jgi:hypothetical protein
MYSSTNPATVGALRFFSAVRHSYNSRVNSLRQLLYSLGMGLVGIRLGVRSISLRDFGCDMGFLHDLL